MDKEALHASIEKNIRFSFSRSGGKGGQNVNKVNTKVHATVPLDSIEGLTDDELIALRKKMHVTADDCVFTDAQDERLQERNRANALERIEQKIIAAAQIKKRRKKTKPGPASVKRRLKAKKIRSLLKADRKTADD